MDSFRMVGRVDRVWRYAVIGALCLIGSGGVHAQPPSYPERAVTMVVPFSAGGATDVLARVYSEPLARVLGQPVVVDNRAGAAGVIGTAAVAKSEADGYRILFAPMAPITIAGNMPGMTLGYDPQKDLAPIAMVARQPVLLVVNAKLPVTTFDELVAYSQKQAQGLNIGSPGTGTDMHLIGARLVQTTGAKLQHVPYKGGGAAITDLVAGHIDALVVVSSSILPQLQSGTVRALATFDPARLAILPDVPSVTELGHADLQADSRWAIFAPPATPPAVVSRLEAAARALDADPALRQRLAELGVVPAYAGPAALASYIRQETNDWRAVINAAKLTP